MSLFFVYKSMALKLLNVFSGVLLCSIPLCCVVMLCCVVPAIFCCFVLWYNMSCCIVLFTYQSLGVRIAAALSASYGDLETDRVGSSACINTQYFKIIIM